MSSVSDLEKTNKSLEINFETYITLSWIKVLVALRIPFESVSERLPIVIALVRIRESQLEAVIGFPFRAFFFDQSKLCRLQVTDNNVSLEL